MAKTKTPRERMDRWNEDQWMAFATTYDKHLPEGVDAIVKATGLDARQVQVRASALRQKGVDLPKLSTMGKIPVDALKEKFGERTIVRRTRKKS